MSKNSAAYVVAIVAVLMFIVGSLVLSVIDPLMQSIFGSHLWTAVTADGQLILLWMERAWLVLPVFILLAIVIELWIVTRQPS